MSMDYTAEAVAFIARRAQVTEEQALEMFKAGYSFTVALDRNEEGWRI